MPTSAKPRSKHCTYQGSWLRHTTTFPAKSPNISVKPRYRRIIFLSTQNIMAVYEAKRIRMGKTRHKWVVTFRDCHSEYVQISKYVYELEWVQIPEKLWNLLPFANPHIQIIFSILINWYASSTNTIKTSNNITICVSNVSWNLCCDFCSGDYIPMFIWVEQNLKRDIRQYCKYSKQFMTNIVGTYKKARRSESAPILCVLDFVVESLMSSHSALSTLCK